MEKKKRSKIIKLAVASVLSIAIIVLVILGIGLILKGGKEQTPIELTKEYLEKYKDCDEEVVKKIQYPFDDNLTDAQKEKYKELIKSQYMALEYEIVEETVGEIDAIIKVQFNVMDYKSSYEKATSYLSLYEKEKTEEKKNDYKLSEIEHTKEKITYSIEFSFMKLDDEWHMQDLTKADLEKLAGIF